MSDTKKRNQQKHNTNIYNPTSNSYEHRTISNKVEIQVPSLYAWCYKIVGIIMHVRTHIQFVSIIYLI